MNFCPHCGGDIRNAGVFPQAVAVAPNIDRRDHDLNELRVVERAPTVPELMKPVPHAATRADFASDEAWEEFQKDSRDLHRRNRIDAAYHAWLLEFPIGSGKTYPSVDEVLAWHESTAKQDGASNAKLLREWREWAASIKHPDIPQPTDKELVEWARARRAAAEGSAGK